MRSVRFVGRFRHKLLVFSDGKKREMRLTVGTRKGLIRNLTLGQGCWKNPQKIASDASDGNSFNANDDCLDSIRSLLQ